MKLPEIGEVWSAIKDKHSEPYDFIITAIIKVDVGYTVIAYHREWDLNGLGSRSEIKWFMQFFKFNEHLTNEKTIRDIIE